MRKYHKVGYRLTAQVRRKLNDLIHLAESHDAQITNRRQIFDTLRGKRLANAVLRITKAVRRAIARRRSPGRALHSKTIGLRYRALPCRLQTNRIPGPYTAAIGQPDRPARELHRTAWVRYRSFHPGPVGALCNGNACRLAS